MTNRLMEAEAVFFSYQTAGGQAVPVLEGFSLGIDGNESVALLGPSGCGKTTILHMLAGFIRPDAGLIRYGGQPLGAPNGKMGVLFQSSALFPWLNVEENIVFGLKRAGLSKSDDRDRCRQFIDLVGLKGFEGAYPGELSGGMQQRAALARILILSPTLLLLDEPFGALDAMTRRSMQKLLLTLRREFPVTTVLITHDVEEAIVLAQRVVVLSQRPAQIVGEVRVPFSGAEGFPDVDSYAFADVKRRVRLLLDGEAYDR